MPRIFNPERGLRRNDPLFNIWGQMRRRCHRPADKAYPNYGGRGITVCDRWRNSFDAFAADMGPRPPGHTIDRINNDAGYSPENCRWITRAQQNRNTRMNRPLTIGGVSRLAHEWSEISGIPQKTILRRARTGWPAERLLDPCRQKAVVPESGISGIHWVAARNRWRVQPRIAGRNTYLGEFQSIEAAKAALDAARAGEKT